MDLETLDRDELERRAARVGVEAPHHKTRRQLIAAISRASGRSRASRTLDAARSLLGLAASIARGLRPTLPLRPTPPRPTRPLRPATSPASERPTVALKPARPTSERPTVALKPAKPTSERPTVALKPAKPTSERPTVALKPARPTSERPTVALKPAQSAPAEEPTLDTRATVPQSRPPKAATPEPISTQTMARLLDAQGHHKRALRIYEELLRSRPDDPALRREMETARGRAKGRRSTTPAREGDDTEADGELIALRVDRTTALVSWELDDAKLAISRALLEEDAPLSAHVLVVFPSDADFVSHELRSCTADREGHWVLADLPEDAHLAISVGLELEAGFHSLVHAPMLPPPA